MIPFGALFNILIFPGFVFLGAFALLAEFFDRRLYARLQNRMGPPWFQPLADLIKLLSKEEIIPEEANPRIFRFMPVLALTAASTAFLYVPLWNKEALCSFQGDLVVVLYLLTIPTLTFFLGGWYSTSVYAKIGAMRAITQLFAYEVPLFMALLAPALLADTWSLSGITSFYRQYNFLWTVNIFGFIIALIALLGKLEKVPFDIPEAETEIVAGAFTEYSGRLYALFRLAIDIEVIVGASLLIAIFFPFGMVGGLAGFVIYVLKVLGVVAILSLLRTVFARFRIDQMIDFCWRYLAPAAFLQLIVNLFIKGFMLK